MSIPVSLPKEASEVVADHLDACFRDQARSGQGWDALQHEWLAAARHITDAEELWIWCGDLDADTVQAEARQHLVAAAAGLLAICSMVEAMRRAGR